MRMAKYRNIISLSVFGSANVLQRGLATLLAILYATQIPPDQLGIYALVLGIAEVAGILSDAGLSQAVVRNYFDNHQRDNAVAFLSRAMLTARVAAIFTLAALVLTGWFAWDWLTAGTVPRWPFLLFAAGIAFFNRIGLMVDSACQAMQRPIEYGIFSFTQAGANIACAILYVYVLDMGLTGALLAVITAMIIANIVRARMMSRILAPTRSFVDRATLRSLFAYGVPLLPKQLAIWGRQMALRLVLAHLVPLALVGAFFFANSLTSILLLANNALASVVSPIYFKRRVAKTPGFQQRIVAFLRVLLAVQTPLFLAAMLLLPPLAEPLLSRGYEAALPVIPLLLANLFFQGQETYMSKQLIFHRRTGLVSLLTVAPIATALALMPLIVPAYGIVGAAWAMIVANAVVLILIQVAIDRLEPSDYPTRAAIICGVLVLGAAVFCSLHDPAAHDLGELALRSAFVVLVAGAMILAWIVPDRHMVKAMLTR